MTVRSRLPIGQSDFRIIRQEDKFYVDKTGLVTEVLDDPGLVVLLPRPRRFGKTTNLSTLRYFFEKTAEDRSALFSDLAVWRSEKARPHFQRHPVILLSFKDVNTDSYPACLAGVADLMATLYLEHGYLLDRGRLSPVESALFRSICERTADQTQIERALHNLSRYLREHHGERVVLLLDEYDTPLHAAFSHGYFDQAIILFRRVLSGVLKDNEHLYKGVLTGILRVAKESVFSDLNHVRVYSLLRPNYSTYFGFTEPEVEALARHAEFDGSLDDLRDWYNGYRFGDTVIYNPWSVLSALADNTCEPYWVNTSSNNLIRELLMDATAEQHRELELLVAGGAIRQKITEHTVLRDVRRDPEALWSFLLFAGYLRAGDVRLDEGRWYADLSIPNRELRVMFTHLFSDWLSNRLHGERQVEALARALLRGDADECQHHLTRLLVDSASSLDVADAPRMPPEQLYHVFVLGLLLHMQPGHLVRSNRESGYGRSDVLILLREPGRPGVVLELKVRRKGQTLAQAAAEGLKQLAAQDYAAELRAHGAAPLHALAVAFDGKQVLVRASRRSAPESASRRSAPESARSPRVRSPRARSSRARAPAKPGPRRSRAQ